MARVDDRRDASFGRPARQRLEIGAARSNHHQPGGRAVVSGSLGHLALVGRRRRLPSLAAPALIAQGV
jgi:hypothetical protein